MKPTLNKIFILGLVVIFIFSLFQTKTFLPTDVLHFLPSFSQSGFVKPKNSLLSDPIYQFEPWRNFAKQQIISGQFPLWNNLNGQGSPFFANPQTTVLFPLNFFYYFLPITFSSYLIPLMKIYFFGFFTYLYLRSLKINKTTSFLSSFVISTSGFFMLWLLWPQTNVFLFFPLILSLIEKIKSKPPAVYRYHLGITVSIFLAILGGHPETLFHMTMISIIYALFRLKNKRLFFVFLLNIFLGFCLGAIQLLPFIEYLLNSYALGLRSNTNLNQSLPIQTFIGNLFPFFLGAPHLQFYKPFVNTNFQEITGGYVGLIIILSALVGILFFWKNSLIKFWSILVLILLAIVYGVFPFSLINSLPVLKSTANTRLLAFGAFGLVTLFAITINELLINERLQKKISELIFYKLSRALLVISAILLTSTFFFRANGQIKLIQFIIFLTQHVLIIATTTLLFYFLLIFLIKKHLLQSKYLFILLLPIILQTTLFFWTYNPSLPKSNYYPQTQLVKKMQSLPKGTYLQVGNLTIPQDTNIIYGLSNAENYDALEVKSYKTAFDKAFPVKNQWSNVDKVTLKSLKEFGISYVLSDYNINDTAQEVQPKYTNLFGPLLKNKIFIIPFVAKGNKLEEIRILPANYNRSNTCTLSIEIIKSDINLPIYAQNIDCENLFDKMFYTIQLQNVNLLPNSNYKLEISSLNSTEQNSIGLWGYKNVPYVELLYKSDSANFIYLGNENNIQIWKVPNVNPIGINIPYKIVHESPSSLTIEYSTKTSFPTKFYIPFYPGWKSTIDGNQLPIKNAQPFISFNLPKGEHIVSIFFNSMSFLLGIFISFTTFVILCLYFFKKELQQRYIKEIEKSWFKKIKTFKKSRLTDSYIILFLSSLIISLFLVIIVNLFFIPKSVGIPETTVVNWFISHKHSIALDYLRFLTLLIIPILTLSVLIVLIWKKSR